MLLILISNADCSTRPTGVDPAILLPSTLKNERLGGGGGKERGKEGREGREGGREGGKEGEREGGGQKEGGLK